MSCGQGWAEEESDHGGGSEAGGWWSADKDASSLSPGRLLRSLFVSTSILVSLITYNDPT